MTKLARAALAGLSALGLAAPATGGALSVGSGAILDLGTASLDLGCGDLTVNGTMAAGSNAIDQALDVDINPGGVLNGESATIEVTGDWDNDGTFNAGTGSLDFVDGCSRATATVSGNSTFATLGLGTTTGKTYLFEAGAFQIITEFFSASGAVGNELLIRSTVGGTASNIVFQGAGQSVSDADVLDNHNVGGPLYLTDNSVSSGNTVGWLEPFLAFSGSFQLEFTGFGGATLAATGTGVATVNGSAANFVHLSTVTLPASWATINTTVSVTDPILTAAGLTGIAFNSVRPGSGVLGPVSGIAANTTLGLASTMRALPVQGNLRFCLLSSNCATTLPLIPPPIGVTSTFNTTTVGSLRALSVVHNPWTLKTATVTNQVNSTATPTTDTRAGFAHGPASLTSSTAAASGMVQFVTGSQISAVGLGEVQAGTFATMTLHFLPEPSLLLALASGAGVLALLGWRRMER